MNGYERIKELFLKDENKDKSLVEIVKHLMQQPNMNELYFNQDKNLEDMMSFIENKAKDQAVNNVAIIPDTQVYDWAILYFTKSNEELGLTKKETPTKTIPKRETKIDDNQLKLEI